MFAPKVVCLWLTGWVKKEFYNDKVYNDKILQFYNDKSLFW